MDDELLKMVAAVDVSTAEKVATFKRWQKEDGTKEGLAKVLALQAFVVALRELCVAHGVGLMPFHNNNGTGGVFVLPLVPGVDPLASTLVEPWE